MPVRGGDYAPLAMARRLLRDKIIVMAKIMLIDPPGWQGASEGNRPFPNVGLAYLVPAVRLFVGPCGGPWRDRRLQLKTDGARRHQVVMQLAGSSRPRAG